MEPFSLFPSKPKFIMVSPAPDLVRIQGRRLRTILVHEMQVDHNIRAYTDAVLELAPDNSDRLCMYLHRTNENHVAVHPQLTEDFVLLASALRQTEI